MQYVKCEDLAERDVENEIFVLNRNDSKLHTFNGTGACIWRALSVPITAHDAAHRIAEEFDVVFETAAADATEFLLELESSGLVKTRDDNNT